MWFLTAIALAAPVDEPVHTGMSSAQDYAVVVGVEDYAFLPDVPHAAADASAVRTWLLASRGIPAQQIELLTDASKEQIEGALSRAIDAVGPQGTVWVYWAGHGAASPTTGGRLLLGVDTMADPAVFEARALSVDALEQQLSSVPHAVLWLDTCYAGTGRSGEALLPGTRFAVPSYATEAPAGLVRWTAAQPGELSQAHPSRHGAFTWASLSALQGAADGELDGARDGAVRADEAQAFVQRALATAGFRNQHPVLDGDGATVFVSGLPAPRAAAPMPSAAPMTPVTPVPPVTPVTSVTPSEAPRAKRGLLIGLGAGAAAALTTAVATRAIYNASPPSQGDLDGLVLVNQVSGWTGIGLGAGFVGVGAKALLERR